MTRHEDDPHYLRFACTIAGLYHFFGDVLDDKNIRICETGELSLVSRFFNEQGYEVEETLSDLRCRIELPDQHFDLVLSLEVIGHLKDQDPKNIDDLVLFNGSGAACYASEIFRILKPGGYVTVTTPNPNSLAVLLRLLEYEPPMVFRPHEREYARAELVSIFEKFDLVYYQTYYCYFHPAEGRAMADDLARSINWKSRRSRGLPFSYISEAVLRSPALWSQA